MKRVDVCVRGAGAVGSCLALALARQSGDLWGQGNALNLLTFTMADAAAQLKLYAEARAAFAAIGDANGLTMIVGNQGYTYSELGLWRRARRLTIAQLDSARRAGKHEHMIGALLNLAMFELQAGSVEAARAWARASCFCTSASIRSGASSLGP